MTTGRKCITRDARFAATNFRFRLRFALFPVVGTGRIDVTRGLVSASVVSRVVAINSSHIKGPDDAIASVHSRAAEIFAKSRAVGRVSLNSTDHSPQVRTSSDPKFGQATRRWNKALRSTSDNEPQATECRNKAYAEPLWDIFTVLLG
ncbi:hypothetical protein AVEN_180771-1 [Araneus ventricosus]|uniref:Uncharacterized protein n=1 Tax=Araneus ventricosus TaxID=182803 RepID=A0A4Y2SJT1_ARAVE|nr:hypothetical protein AVEN_113558-1 [Araneus ventricosus]GBN87509.1 hypothetical protein AVEN_180771-1 [Araneus ventricosus]